MSVNDSNNFEVDLSNYSGPLDVLLDLAKSQKVNLAEISIAELADQFNTFINKAKRLNLDLASEYLLMATWLTYQNLNYYYQKRKKKSSKFQRWQKNLNYS